MRTIKRTIKRDRSDPLVTKLMKQVLDHGESESVECDDTLANKIRNWVAQKHNKFNPESKISTIYKNGFVKLIIKPTPNPNDRWS